MYPKIDKRQMSLSETGTENSFWFTKAEGDLSSLHPVLKTTGKYNKADLTHSCVSEWRS